MDRREFIKTTALSAAVLAISTQFPVGRAFAANDQTQPDVVAIRNGNPVTMFRLGMEALGGMTAFVKPRNHVVIKPNIGWDQPPEMAANTNPELIGEIVRQCFAAGAGKVSVFDHTCNEWKSCYKNSGIEQAVLNAGGEIVTGANIEDYVDRQCPGAVKMKTAKIHKLILEADVFFNAPILKHHGGAQLTCAMKNFMGLVWDRGFMHNNDLHQSIADAVLYRKPDLNIVDAYRIMTANGPRGVTLNDVKTPKYLILSRNIVAVDAVAAKLIGFDPYKIDHLKYGEAHGLGNRNIDNLKILRLEA